MYTNTKNPLNIVTLLQISHKQKSGAEVFRKNERLTRENHLNKKVKKTNVKKTHTQPNREI